MGIEFEEGQGRSKAGIDFRQSANIWDRFDVIVDKEDLLQMRRRELEERRASGAFRGNDTIV